MNVINTRLDRLITFIPNEYLILLCYILQDDRDKIVEISNLIVENKIINDPQNLITIIKKYYTLKKEGFENDEIIKTLKNGFDVNEVENFINFKNGLSFERIKNLIAKSNKERVKFDRENNVKFSHYPQEVQEKLLNAEQKLIQRYKENLPNQMDLANVFDFI
jgi:hypothetical protein